MSLCVRTPVVAMSHSKVIMFLYIHHCITFIQRVGDMELSNDANNDISERSLVCATRIHDRKVIIRSWTYISAFFMINLYLECFEMLTFTS